MAEEKREIWFPAKTYGWGWGAPCAWQGWVVVFIYIGLVVAATIVIQPKLNMKLFLEVVAGLTFLFLLICWWKGEKPNWRWGDKK